MTRVVNQIADLERVAEIPRLLRRLAARSAEELNVAKLASEFGWAARTIDAYLAQLSSVFILQLLPAWSVDLSSKVVHRPKVHLLHTGLAAALCGLTAQRLLDAPERFGGLLETFVVMELRKQLSWSGTQPLLWHFRDRGDAEVDVVLEYPDGRVVGIEVKSGATPSHADARGLRLLRDRLGDRFHQGYLATTAPEARPLEDRLSGVPGHCPLEPLTLLACPRLRRSPPISTSRRCGRFAHRFTAEHSPPIPVRTPARISRAWRVLRRVQRQRLMYIAFHGSRRHRTQSSPRGMDRRGA